jgi:hypothetical protein
MAATLSNTQLLLFFTDRPIKQSHASEETDDIPSELRASSEECRKPYVSDAPITLCEKWGTKDLIAAQAMEKEMTEEIRFQEKRKAISDVRHILAGRIDYHKQLLEFVHTAPLSEVMEHCSNIGQTLPAQILLLCRNKRELEAKLLLKDIFGEALEADILFFQSAIENINFILFHKYKFSIDILYDFIRAAQLIERWSIKVKDKKNTHFEHIHHERMLAILEPHLSTTYAPYRKLGDVNITLKANFIFKYIHTVSAKANKCMDAFYAHCIKKFLHKSEINFYQTQYQKLKNSYDAYNKRWADYCKESELFQADLLRCNPAIARQEQPLTAPQRNEALGLEEKLRTLFDDFYNIASELDMLTESLESLEKANFAPKRLPLDSNKIPSTHAALEKHPSVPAVGSVAEIPQPTLSAPETIALPNTSDEDKRKQEREEAHARQQLALKEQFQQEKERILQLYKENVAHLRAEKIQKEIELKRLFEEEFKFAAELKTQQEEELIDPKIITEQLRLLNNQLNSHQKEVLRKLFTKPSKNESIDVTYDEFWNLVIQGLKGTIEYRSSGSSHFCISLPNTFSDWKLIDNTTLSYIDDFSHSLDTDLPQIKAGSFKNHGKTHSSRVIHGFARKLCCTALERAGITPFRLQKVEETIIDKPKL